MTKEISFEKNAAGDYSASFTSTGPVTFQAERATNASVSVSANIPGMKPCVVGVYQNAYNFGILIGIDIPVGMTVTIETPGEIKEAKVMSDD